MTVPEILANHALGSNPPTADIHQSTHGSDWLWAVFAIMLLSDLMAVFWSIRRPRNFLFHQLAVVILTTSSIAYFSMASNLGHTPIVVEWDRSHGSGILTRDVWYVRYIQWFINAPLLLLIMFLGTGFPLMDGFLPLFFADAAVVLGLVGALVHSTYKWGYFTMGVFSLFYVWYVPHVPIFHLIFDTGREAFPTRTGRTRGGFLGSAFVLTFLWLLYPLVWALDDGSDTIGPTGEVVWYGILDLLTGPVFLSFLWWSHREVDLAGTTTATQRQDVKA
ncbi:family A G protein-coupled receptor-like protein [Artomyces pyxidatus]|uniref:Family A G protein-coupled receptor-like protein n=1 Tax=Artomyces pyxidatus TaxID=48021 RepID=A0ACB8SVL0_9AGAM|nr:family A G protein-coupled receptor-like protein [Artomyces pyxidatus]